MKKNKLPNDKVYRDMIRVNLLQERLKGYFDSQLPDKMEQAYIQVMLAESQEIASEVLAEIESGGNFTALVNKFSYELSSKERGGDLGWLPEELMPTAITSVFQLELGEVSQPTYDDSAIKGIGYWLIEVTDKDEEKGINARAILLGSKQEAEEVKAKLTSENFADLAKEYSQHQASKDNGGELEWLKEGDMNSDAFDEVAFALDLNVITEPVKDESVQTRGGYWVVKVLEKGEHELSEEVRGLLAGKNFNQWLQEQRMGSIINNYLDEEKKSLAVERVLKGK
jgi:parvulin-like peptidyl-prolyl isomerase